MIRARITSPTTMLVSNADAGWFEGRAPAGSLLVLEVAGTERTVPIVSRENLFTERLATRDSRGRVTHEGPIGLGLQILIGAALDAPINSDVLIVGYAHPEVSR